MDVRFGTGGDPNMVENQRRFGRKGLDSVVPRDAAGNEASMPISYVWFASNGRINRKVYWQKGFLLMFLFQIVFQSIAMAIDFGLVTVLGPESIGRFVVAVIIGLPFLVFMLWVSFAVTVKRFHDRGRTAWFLLIVLIPFIGFIWLAVELMFLKGTSGENRFGPDPLTANA